MVLGRSGHGRVRGRVARVVVAAAALGAALIVPVAHPAHAATGTLTRYTDLALPYWVYVPSTYTGATKVPLVVYLHGCNQTPQDVAVGTKWDAEAEAKGFIVAYPEQQVGLYPLQPGNVSKCWNFASPLEWSRTGFETQSIAQITQHVSSTWAIDTTHVYIAGASAGGAMASVLAAFYPELYSAIGVAAGCGFPCGDATGTVAYQSMGANKRAMPVMFVNGATDPVVNAGLGEDSLEQWLGTNDWVDDGQYNGSVSRQPATITNYGFNQTPQPLSGDPCIDPTGPPKLPCAGGIIGFQGTYPYTVRTYNDATGHDLIDYWLVYGMSHGYVGGDPSGSFTDPLGPDITDGFYNFFIAHPR